MAEPARDLQDHYSGRRFWKNRMPNAVEWAALALFGISVLILVSLLLDPPSRLVRRAGGGFFLSREPFLLFGAGTYLLVGLVGFWSAVIFLRNRIHHLTLKVFGVTMMAVSFSTLLAIGASEPVSKVHYGGYVGVLITQAFEGVSPLLSMPLVGIIFIISMVFATDWFFYELLRGDARQEPAMTDTGRLMPGLSAVEEEALTGAPATAVAAPPPYVVEAEEAAPSKVGAQGDPVASAPEAPGPMIARRILPELEPVRPVETAEEAEPEEGRVATSGEAAAAIVEEATEAPSGVPEAGSAEAPVMEVSGFRLYLPDLEETEEEEEAPREFTGKIAAYLEDEEEEEEEAYPPAGAEAAYAVSVEVDEGDEAEAVGEVESEIAEAQEEEAEEEAEEEDDRLEPDARDAALTGDATEEAAEEVEARADADEAEERAPADALLFPELHGAVDVEVREDEEEEEDTEEEETGLQYALKEPEEAEEADVEAFEEDEVRHAAEPDEAEATESRAVETKVVDAAEENIFEVIATLDEPHTSRALDDDEAVEEEPVDDEAVEEDDEDDTDEYELEDEPTEDEEDDTETAFEEIDEEVISLDLEEDLDHQPSNRMLYAEAFDEEATRPAAVDTRAHDDEEDEDPLAEAARRRAPEPFAPGEDPFADAPMTGDDLEESAAGRPGRRRSRRTAAKLDLAMEELLPSLSRMQQKITDLEVTEADPAGESGNDRIYRKAVDAIFESNRASAAVLKRKLRVDGEQADVLLSRMETEGLVGPRKGKQGTRDILISRREFEASHDAPRA